MSKRDFVIHVGVFFQTRRMCRKCKYDLKDLIRKRPHFFQLKENLSQERIFQP